MTFKFQSDSINTQISTSYSFTGLYFKFQSDSINTETAPERQAALASFKFQSDSINTFATMYLLCEQRSL